MMKGGGVGNGWIPWLDDFCLILSTSLWERNRLGRTTALGLN